MSPAVDTLAGFARAVSTHDARAPIVSNLDGHAVQDGRDVLSRIVRQVSSPVRWDLCMQTMAELGVTGVIEVPPAGTLTGLIRRALPDVETVALKTPDDLDAARDLAERHGRQSPLDDSPSWRMIVARSKGTFVPGDATTGTRLEPGGALGTLITSRGEETVLSPHGGTVIEWLVEDGDPVAPGQPLVRLHPEAVS